MKKPAKSLTSLVLGTVAVSVMSLLLPQSSWAQTTDVNPLQDFNADQSSDPFSRNNEGNSFGVFDLIHRANLNGRSVDDYTSEQNQNLNTAAAEFRKKQRERLQVQQQATPTNPGNTQVAN